MSIPMDERKIVAPGLHDASLEEVGQTFGQFQVSDRRIVLFRKLQAYYAELQNAKCGTSLIIDGSFVILAVDEPDDIDVIRA